MSGSTVRPVLLSLVALAACGRGDDPNTLVRRDSSGVAIVAYPASVRESAPVWQLSEKPVMVLGGDSVDASMDLSTAVAATFLRDGNTVVSTTNPSELLLFDSHGMRTARLGAPGNGAGEFRSIAQLLPFGDDTVFAFDATLWKGLFFAANGRPLGERVFPSSVLGAPPALRGRLHDGSFVFSLDMMTDSVPQGLPKPYRNRFFVLGLKAEKDRFDTLGRASGAEMMPSTMMVGGQPTAIGRPLIFGAVTQVAAAGNHWYLSRADRFEIETHDSAGKLLRVVRLASATRPVTPADQEKYKSTVREAYQRVKAMVPEEILAQEMKKLDETSFADHLPAIAQMLTDQEGNLWVDPGFSLLDKFRSWLIFSPEGELVGRTETPIGTVLAIGGDRVLVRREDAVTRKVQLEVYAVTKGAPAGADTTKH